MWFDSIKKYLINPKEKLNIVIDGCEQKRPPVAVCISAALNKPSGDPLNELLLLFIRLFSLMKRIIRVVHNLLYFIL